MKVYYVTIKENYWLNSPWLINDKIHIWWYVRWNEMNYEIYDLKSYRAPFWIYWLSFHRITLVVKQMGCSPYEGVWIIPFGTCNGIYQHCPGMYCAALVAKKENECNFRCTCSRPCFDIVIPVGPLPRSSNESMISEVIVTQVWRIYPLGQKLSPILNFRFN